MRSRRKLFVVPLCGAFWTVEEADWLLLSEVLAYCGLFKRGIGLGRWGMVVRAWKVDWCGLCRSSRVDEMGKRDKETKVLFRGLFEVVWIVRRGQGQNSGQRAGQPRARARTLTLDPPGLELSCGSGSTDWRFDCFYQGGSIQPSSSSLTRATHKQNIPLQYRGCLPRVVVRASRAAEQPEQRQ